MKYIESPNIYKSKLNEKSLFIAGGISNCPDWQQEMVKMLSDSNAVLINPRQAIFPLGDPVAAKKQVSWEHDHLRIASAILFWFSPETLCPIVLYELGAWSMVPEKPIFVGIHPEYARCLDVEVQTKLARPEVEIVYHLSDLAAQLKVFLAA